MGFDAVEPDLSDAKIKQLSKPLDVDTNILPAEKEISFFS
jgi:hypothetical protein